MTTTTNAKIELDAATALAIGVEGYTYLQQLILMDLTRRQLTNVRKLVPPADFKVVVKPNFDTLYCSAFLDLHNEPRSMVDLARASFLLCTASSPGVQRSPWLRSACRNGVSPKPTRKAGEES